MEIQSNVINWFEIAVSDIERATKFYEAILCVKMEPWEGADIKMSLFPADSSKGVLGGALAQSPWHHPSGAGVVIYLNANPDLINVLNRVEKAGGSIIMPKTLITDQIGYMAFFTDTEGNTIALHSNN